mmetsp:Transcript_6256/g.12465  ORF Transcript_6256/g.12465 Transcript_6256/m.12465 type:complete len:133 (+) Transcript_6256:44-442(+)
MFMLYRLVSNMGLPLLLAALTLTFGIIMSPVAYVLHMHPPHALQRQVKYNSIPLMQIATQIGIRSLTDHILLAFARKSLNLSFNAVRERKSSAALIADQTEAIITTMMLRSIMQLILFNIRDSETVTSFVVV